MIALSTACKQASIVINTICYEVNFETLVTVYHQHMAHQKPKVVLWDHGPGSFTGLRLASVWLQTLHLLHPDCIMLGISGLDVMAFLTQHNQAMYIRYASQTTVYAARIQPPTGRIGTMDRMHHAQLAHQTVVQETSSLLTIPHTSVITCSIDAMTLLTCYQHHPDWFTPSVHPHYGWNPYE
jgi:tRNA A37 threonylcarbamoyladenosine modification protein TsaB